MITGDPGLFIGTAIILVLGLGVALLLPILIEKQGSVAELPVDRARLIRWIRILGSIVIGITIVEMIVMLLL
jgi:hypothetical protein